MPRWLHPFCPFRPLTWKWSGRGRICRNRLLASIPFNWQCLRTHRNSVEKETRPFQSQLRRWWYIQDTRIRRTSGLDCALDGGSTEETRFWAFPSIRSSSEDGVIWRALWLSGQVGAAPDLELILWYGRLFIDRRCLVLAQTRGWAQLCQLVNDVRQGWLLETSAMFTTFLQSCITLSWTLQHSVRHPGDGASGPGEAQWSRLHIVDLMDLHRLLWE